MQTAVLKKSYFITFTFVMVTLLSFVLFADISFADNVLQQKVDSVGNGIWDFLKDIAKIIMTVVIAMMGYSLLISKSAESLAEMKGKVLIVLACFFFVFGAGWIVDFFSGLFA